MPTDRIEVYAAPEGSSYGDGSPGYPVRDLHAAVRLIRQRRVPGQRAVVWLAPGTYPQEETLELGPEDSFTSFVARDRQEPAVVEGAVHLTAWRWAQAGGRPVLASPAPVARARALYVDGVRAPRPRLPRGGLLRIEEQDGLDPSASFVGTLFDGADRFRYAEGDIPALSHPEAVEAVVPHYWVQERMPLTGIDRDRREVRSSRRSIFALRDDATGRHARYWLDNVAEMLGDVAGEWYLDGSGQLTGLDGPQLLYVPREGESAESLEAVLPVLDVFVRLTGTPQRPVHEVRFEGIGFAYADFAEAPPARAPFGVREDPALPTGVDFASEVQAASTVPGAIELTYARSCAFVDGAIEHVGGFGVALGPGCRGNLISGSRFADLGAGAVRSGGSVSTRSPAFNRANEVSDNDIDGGGRVYPQAVAVLFMHGSHNVIAHNHIRDLFYTGISVGWTWDYADSPSRDNLVVGNHIHHLGQGRLNDMGGIYLLGIAPGTVVRGNHIHDVECANYGGWGIYLDEGSSHVVVESNVVHDVSSQAYHHHYGRESVVRHNVFAFGREGQVSITRPEDHVAFTFERNIVVGEGSPGFVGTVGERDVRRYGLVSDLNCFWDYRPVDGALRAANGRRAPRPDGGMEFALVESLDEEWAALGHDRHSRDADPRFRDPHRRDLAVEQDSPARDLGIRVPDVTRAGPRPRGRRPHPLAAPTSPDGVRAEG